MGVVDFTPQADGELSLRPEKTAPAFVNRMCQAQVSFPVRHPGQLGEQGAGRGESGMDVPQRAYPAKAGKMKACGALAFGNIAGDVDPDEIEGDTFIVGALQGA